jgi:hypothetical protein
MESQPVEFRDTLREIPLSEEFWNDLIRQSIVTAKSTPCPFIRAHTHCPGGNA